MHPANLQAVVFDAYGTLFDVHSVIALGERLFPERGEALSRLWRQKQLEYTWLRSLMGRYVDFWQVTGDSLQWAAASLGLALGAAEFEQLRHEYLRLKTFPEVPGALRALAPRPLAILSNGSPKMLQAVVEHNRLAAELPLLFSVDAVGVYKTDPRVYQMAVDGLAKPKEAILFVSSNNWDAQGARSFGFPVAWVNRSGQSQEALGFPVDWVVKGLDEIAARLGG